MIYDGIRNDHGFANDPIKALVAPRPIGWISSLSKTGVSNLAPYSFFNLVSEDPHYVAFGTSEYKNTIANVEATREFAVNLVSHALKDAMNKTSGNFPPDSDEFEIAGIEKAPCKFIKPFCVKLSPAVLECRHFLTEPLPSDDGTVENWLVVGRVVGIQIQDEYIADGRVSTANMQLIARLGYSEYATVTEAWRMRR